MIRTVLLLLLLSLFKVSFAQERDLVKEMEENYIQIRQVSGSEPQLREWMNGLNLDEDTIYALIYVPMDCPRCEVAIPNFRAILRKVDPNQKMVLITAYTDSVAAKDYNQRKDYCADAYLYDTTERYSKIFNTNMSGGLMGLHILKIDKKRGELLTGGEYTVLNELFVKQLIGYKGKLEKSSFPIVDADNDSSYTEIPKEFPLLRTSKKYLLDRSATVSSIYDIPRFIDDKLFFTDVLQNGVMLYKQDKDNLKLVKVLQVNSIEKNRFVKVPQKVYDDFAQRKMFYYIALGTNLLDDQHIGISYSIPKVVQDGAENAYGFYNAPVIISRNIHTLEPDSMLALDFELDIDTTFFNTHYSFTSFKNSIVVGCEKLTWPMEYEREDYESIPEKNPFRPAFYEFQTPFIASFDKTNGHLIQRYGNLDKVHAESRTGYYFTNPIASTFDNEFLFTDGYSGKLYITNETSKEALCYQAFSLKSEDLPKPDSTLFYTYEHAKIYARFFNRCIIDVKFNNKEIHCITKYSKPDSNKGARYAYTIINRKTKKAQTFAFPRTEEITIGCGLRLKDTTIHPFTIQKVKNSTVVYELKK